MSEIERITDIANNNGYYSFNKEYVKFRYDTFKDKHELDVYVKVLEESDTTNFKTFQIDSLRILINAVDEIKAKTSKHEITDLKMPNLFKIFQKHTLRNLSIDLYTSILILCIQRN